MPATPARTGTVEADIGLTAYATSTPGLGGRLKVLVDDFRVEELGGRPAEDATGRYVAARVRLANWETNAFVREASRRLGVSRKKIHWSGTKDKRAVSERWFTFEADLVQVGRLGDLAGVRVEETFRTSSELDLGHHAGNRFRLVLRDARPSVAAANALLSATWAELVRMGGSPNFFGPQRFGARRATTHRVGARMIRGEFEAAVADYLGDPVWLVTDDDRRAWRSALDQRAWKTALSLVSGDARFERALLHRLAETDGDAVRALLALPANLQRLFVYAYQSLFFNRIVSRRLAAGHALNAPLEGDLVAPVENGEVEEEWVPVTPQNHARAAREVSRGRAAVTGLLPGTEAPLAAGAMGRIEREVLGEAGVEARDFLIPEHVEWSSKGTRRALVAPVRGFQAAAAPDDLHPGRTRVDFAFDLPAGSYATALLREFAKSARLLDYG